MTDTTVERVVTEAPAEPGDHDRFAHYVNKNDIMKAAVEGTPATALCGKVWVPNRDGLKFPVCQECKKIYDELEFD